MLHFELTLQEANTILGLLGKHPFDTVAPLITKIQQQAQPQLPALEAKMKAEAEAVAAQKAAEEAQKTA